ncbi:hypothetical protein [Clostridium cylindrosporum]|uniref:Uncharacterized protein n=1 Tax=Clostridium cylindrosporum DSM 605 TaxID=1121307 RepID=A0A0J8DG16_CLOCY|nr:hypothetical protein [Clostridium cylindrosporum]KMT23179.1 hypothetical protein CLCY_6c00600 [Clostridium cylindrosporum DSM 605]
MGKGLIVIEKEKIRHFEKLLHIAKGNNTLNMFLEKCNVDPLYIEWAISGRSFVIPHDNLLRILGEASEGRVSFEKFKNVFKGYEQPMIKEGQIWFISVKEEEKAYYIVDSSVCGEYSNYIKVAPIVDYRHNIKGDTIKLIYETLDGIILKNVIILDDYKVVEKSTLLSFIANLKNDLVDNIEDIKYISEDRKGFTSYFKKILYKL